MKDDLEAKKFVNIELFLKAKERKEAEAEISIPTSSGLAQSNETSQPENTLNKSKIGCDDIALILPPNIANVVTNFIC